MLSYQGDTAFLCALAGPVELLAVFWQYQYREVRSPGGLNLVVSCRVVGVKGGWLQASSVALVSLIRTIGVYKFLFRCTSCQNIGSDSSFVQSVMAN